MRKSVLVAILFLFFVSFIPLNAQWARTYGGKSWDGAYVTQQTTDGGYVVAGYTNSFGSGLEDFWILKLTPYGEIEWQKTYGGGQYEFVESIQQTTDGGYILIGCSESFGVGWSMDIWILKLDFFGEIEWQKRYSTGEDWSWNWANSIQQTNDSGYIVAGSVDSYPLVLKLLADGSIEWQRSWDREVEISSIRQTSDNGYIAIGWIQGGMDVDLCVLKLESIGTIEWQYAYSGTFDDFGKVVQQTDDGGYILAGDTNSFGAGGTDSWILKLTPYGVIEWQKTYGGNLYDGVHSIQQTTDGGYVAAGYTESFGAEESNAWIIKISSNSEIEWQKTYGGNYDDSFFSIQQTTDGGYVAAGYTESFGAGGESDIWILKLFSDGDIHSSCGFIENSDATITDTFVQAVLIGVTVQNITVTASDTTISPQDSDAIVALLCEAPEYTLTISATSGGTTDPSPNTYIHYEGTDVIVQAAANSGYNFTGWSGDASGTTNPITITMDSDKSITANFEAIPEPPEPPDEGNGNGGGCFIATAAYGSPLHPHIDILRDFRDQYLVTNKIGQALVNFYYKYSPSIANFISKHKLLKIAVRIHLRPLISLSYLIVH